MSTKRKSKREFPPLCAENKPAVKTAQAAHYLDRAPRTLRGWATAPEASPIQPIRVGKRLAWPVADIKRILGVA
jgi:hypothetical protein